MRRMPVIFLVDTSGRMQGERIKAVNKGMQTILQGLRMDTYALETVWLSVSTYNMQFTPLNELTELSDFELPEIMAVPSTSGMIGLAIYSLSDWLKVRINKETLNKKGDFRGKVIIIWGGGIADPKNIEAAEQKMKKLPVDVLVLAVGSNKSSMLPESWDCISLENQGSDTAWHTIYTDFFKWVEDDICCPPSEPVSHYLPPLPKEIII